MKAPRPEATETPVDYADRLANWYVSQSGAVDRKTLGQYMTPISVARYMAIQAGSASGTVRLLDPGAGTGILTCALCEFFATRRNTVRRIEVVAFEIHSTLALLLQRSLCYLKNYLAERGVDSSFHIETADFVLSQAHALDAGATLFGSHELDAFDFVIANPPYFKIAKCDPRSQSALAVVHGQPNIYTLFMAVGASLLRENGRLITITPRSFASGPYFQRFREWFFERMQPCSVHIFQSRRDAFRRDDVLQENVILTATKKRDWLRGKTNSFQVTISSSEGANDLKNPSKNRVRISQVLIENGHGKVLRIPDTGVSEAVREIVNGWHGTLAAYGLWISTGPVVPFRATNLLSDGVNDMKAHAPLLWMQHVGMMNVTWPLPNVRKPQFISTGPEARRLLVKNENYVLIRRFSAKEQPRRLTAAPYERTTLRTEVLGLENHLNYLYRPHGKLTPDETWGLAVLLNSMLLDVYFRSINGNTQVSATELRHIPLPDLDAIREIGQRARHTGRMQCNVDQVIEEVLCDKRIPSLKRAIHVQD
ncbi:MAG: Eco57I restriction-modification methylase domain-containing protein [Candidatus Zixiibacteriota bacterium]